jgi:hypothetical protein
MSTNITQFTPATALRRQPEQINEHERHRRYFDGTKEEARVIAANDKRQRNWMLACIQKPDRPKPKGKLRCTRKEGRSARPQRSRRSRRGAPDYRPYGAMQHSLRPGYRRPVRGSGGRGF